MDLLLICPGNNKVIYQELSKQYAAVEPPIWGALLANFARKVKGYEVAILDQEAEGLSSEAIASKASEWQPRLIAIVVYGQQPSASTQNMTMAGEVAAKIKDPRFFDLEQPLMGRYHGFDFILGGDSRGPAFVESLSKIRPAWLLLSRPGNLYKETWKQLIFQGEASLERSLPALASFRRLLTQQYTFVQEVVTPEAIYAGDPPPDFLIFKRRITV